MRLKVSHRSSARATVLVLGLPIALFAVVVVAQIHGLDFRVYRDGALAMLGMDGDRELYGSAPGTPGLPFTYPPFAALAFTPFAFIPDWLGLWFITGTSLVCLVLTAIFVVGYLTKNRLVPGRGGDPGVGSVWPVVVAAVLIGVMGPWREGLGFGQINPMIMVLIVVDLIRPATRVPRGALIGLAAGIKLTPLAFGLIFLVRRDWRAVIALGTSFAGTIAVGWLFMPGQASTFWFSSLSNPHRVGDTSDMYNVSLNSLVSHLGAPESLQRPLWLSSALAVILLGFFTIQRAERNGDLVAAISANAIVMLAISPISWFHHWVWIVLIVPALYVSAKRRPLVARRIGIVVIMAMIPLFMLSSITITFALDGKVSGRGPVGLEVFTSLGVMLAIVALVYWLTERRGLIADMTPGKLAGRA
ncbi:glycosyltransferase 87 family protein [Arthrobacter sp. HLT1-21]